MTTFDIITWCIGAFITGLMIGHKFLPPRRNPTQDLEINDWRYLAITAHGHYLAAGDPEAFKAWKNFSRYNPPEVVFMVLAKNYGYGEVNDRAS